jgi:hypothetical protein
MVVEMVKGEKRRRTWATSYISLFNLQDILLLPCTGTYMRLLSVHAVHFSLMFLL